jgi:imidazolonepropionase-like amidohydrolase
MPPDARPRRLITAPQLLDVASGRWLDDRRILVAGERIEAILAPGEPAPADAVPVVLGGRWVVPGLIDSHSHLVGELEYAGIPAMDVSPAQEAMSGVRNARDTLRAGFTTVRDVGTFWAFVDVALRDAIEAGWTPGPRMQCAGAYITCPGGGGEVTGEAPSMGLPDALRFGVVQDPEEVRAKVRALIAGGASVIKCIVTGAVLTRGTDVGAVELPEPLVRAAVEEAAANGAYVAAHAHGTEGIKVAIRAGVRSIEHGSLIDDEGIAMLVDTGTYWVADVYDGDWIAQEGARAGWPAETMAKNDATTQAQRDAFTKAVAAGVRLAYGTDSGVYPHPMVAIQLGYQVRQGQTPAAAIRSATLTAAELMGWDDRVGSIAPGRFADLVAVDGDPLDDIDVLRRPTDVLKAGVPVELGGVSG